MTEQYSSKPCRDMLDAIERLEAIEASDAVFDAAKNGKRARAVREFLLQQPAAKPPNIGDPRDRLDAEEDGPFGVERRSTSHTLGTEWPLRAALLRAREDFASMNTGFEGQLGVHLTVAGGIARIDAALAASPPDGTAPERADEAERLRRLCTDIAEEMTLLVDSNLPMAASTVRNLRDALVREAATRPPDGMPGEPNDYEDEHPENWRSEDGGGETVRTMAGNVEVVSRAAPPTVPGEPPLGVRAHSEQILGGRWALIFDAQTIEQSREACERARLLATATPPTPPRAPVDADLIPRTSGNGCVCWECGLGIAIDEDGCCVHCGGQAGAITRLHELADEARKFTEGAPVDEAAVRADERARTERDIAAWLRRFEGKNQEYLGGIVERSDYPRTAATSKPERPTVRDCTCGYVGSTDGRCRGVGGLGAGWRCVKLGRGPTPEERAEAKRWRDECIANMTGDPPQPHRTPPTEAEQNAIEDACDKALAESRKDFAEGRRVSTRWSGKPRVSPVDEAAVRRDERCIGNPSGEPKKG